MTTASYTGTGVHAVWSFCGVSPSDSIVLRRIILLTLNRQEPEFVPRKQPLWCRTSSEVTESDQSLPGISYSSQEVSEHGFVYGGTLCKC